MSLDRTARERPVATAVACAALQFALTMAILVAGRALAPPEAFGKVKLLAFVSTLLLPLLLVQLFGLWRQVGLAVRKGWPAPVFFASLLLVAMNLSLGVHPREGGSFGGELTFQFFNAFGEELLFRGLIFALLLRLPVWQAIVLNGVMFGSMHLLHGFMGGSWSHAAWQATLTAMGGMMFAAIRYRSASLWPVIAIHMLKNLSVVYSNLEFAGGLHAESLAEGATVVFELLLVAYVIWKTPQRDSTARVPASVTPQGALSSQGEPT